MEVVMAFYTNIQRLGNKILHRGYDENNKRVSERVDFMPTLFIPTKKRTGWTDLYNNNVAPIQPGTMSECKEFLASYKEVDNFKILGNQKYHIQFTHDTYPDEIKTDLSKIHICYIDIETEDLTGNFPGFSTAQEVDHSVVTIAVVDENNKKYVFGLVDYTPVGGEVYFKCKNEHTLLTRWLTFMQH